MDFGGDGFCRVNDGCFLVYGDVWWRKVSCWERIFSALRGGGVVYRCDAFGDRFNARSNVVRFSLESLSKWADGCFGLVCPGCGGGNCMKFFLGDGGWLFFGCGCGVVAKVKLGLFGEGLLGVVEAKVYLAKILGIIVF